MTSLVSLVASDTLSDNLSFTCASSGSSVHPMSLFLLPDVAPKTIEELAPRDASTEDVLARVEQEQEQEVFVPELYACGIASTTGASAVHAVGEPW